MEYFIYKSKESADANVQAVTDAWLPQYLIDNPTEVGHTFAYCDRVDIDNGEEPEEYGIIRDSITIPVVKDWDEIREIETIF